jgi:3-hydroxyisobutyrate dehydrogenase-like beta-hydroxyacid dehydrogenase
MTRVAVLGLGIMGHGIAENFLRQGYDVAVWNRSPEKARDLAARGATMAGSVADAVDGAELVFEVTANDESSRAVWFGEDGILAHAKPDQFLITCATLSVEFVDELAKMCAAKGLTFFDMPMTGSRAGAENGQLVLLAGGDEQKLSEVKLHLGAVASQVKYFGPAGYGMRTKLVLNCLQAVHLAGFGEAMRLAKAFGLDEKLTGDMLVEKPGGATTQMAWRDYQNYPEPINFAVELIAKDEAYALKSIDPDVAPLIAATLAAYQKAIADGHAQDDWTYIAR